LIQLLTKLKFLLSKKLSLAFPGG